MNKLLRIELERALKNKLFYICLLIGLICVGVDVYTVAYRTRKAYDMYLNLSIYQVPGVYCKWMVTNGSSMYKLLHLIFPLLISAPYTYTMYSDIKSGYIDNIVSRIDKKYYYGAKLMTQFVTGFLIVFIVLATSFIATAAILPFEHPTRASFIYGVHYDIAIGRLFYTKPFLSCIIYIFLEALIFGIIGCIGFVFAYILTNGVMVMLSPFIVYYAEFIIKSSLGKPDILRMTRIGMFKHIYIKPFLVEISIIIIGIGISYFVRARKKDVF